MTFKELAKEVTKEVNIENKTKIPKKLVEIILRDTIRVMIEELVANPYEATVSISNLGKFYLREFKTRGGFTDEDGFYHPNKVEKVFTLRFKAYPDLRDIFKGKKKIEDLKISKNVPLYPNSESAKRFLESRYFTQISDKKNEEDKLQLSFKRKYIKKKKETYKLTDKQEVNVEGRLPDEDA